MKRALELARRGIALTSPNPCVGAVITGPAGEFISEGWHTYEGRKHAEVVAIEQAGERARGATLYLNLEPCSHTGRTGPCAGATVATLRPGPAAAAAASTGRWATCSITKTAGST